MSVRINEAKNYVAGINIKIIRGPYLYSAGYCVSVCHVDFSNVIIL